MLGMSRWLAPTGAFKRLLPNECYAAIPCVWFGGCASTGSEKRSRSWCGATRRRTLNKWPLET
eukprot:10221521-Prorocentrum_lima.AAC.1